jgi:hypothetical protein
LCIVREEEEGGGGGVEERMSVGLGVAGVIVGEGTAEVVGVACGLPPIGAESSSLVISGSEEEC